MCELCGLRTFLEGRKGEIEGGKERRRVKKVGEGIERWGKDWGRERVLLTSQI